MTKHVYFTKLMYFLKLQTIKILKRKILFNIFLLGQNCLVIAVSGAPSIGNLDERAIVRWSDRGILSYETLTHVLCCLYKETSGPTEGETQELYSRGAVRLERSGAIGVPGCLAPGSLFAYLLLSPL